MELAPAQGVSNPTLWPPVDHALDPPLVSVGSQVNTYSSSNTKSMVTTSYRQLFDSVASVATQNASVATQNHGTFRRSAEA